jgi:hypothetical protein
MEERIFFLPSAYTLSNKKGRMMNIIYYFTPLDVLIIIIIILLLDQHFAAACLQPKTWLQAWSVDFVGVMHSYQQRDHAQAGLARKLEVFPFEFVEPLYTYISIEKHGTKTIILFIYLFLFFFKSPLKIKTGT